jgi:hypothetical protein
MEAPWAGSAGTLVTDVPHRLDRLPSSRRHRVVVIALGIAWVLDGLEVTVVGEAATAYLIGASLGAMLHRYPLRSFVSLSLMVAQAIFFTEALVPTTFFNVPPDRVPLYIFPFAVGNLLGPLVLGCLFDTAGRKTMITAKRLRNIRMGAGRRGQR